jgi:hypothetical protein
MKKRRAREVLPDSAERKIRAWEESTGVSVLSDTQARAALATLFCKQCDPLMVLELLRRFSGLGIDFASLRKRMKQILKRVEKLGRRLKEDAKEVRAVEQFLKLGVDFPDEMDEFSQYLVDIYPSEVKSTVLSRGSGLQAELVDLVRLVEMATGRPHYREIAELLRAIDGKTPSEDDLRKKVENFENGSRFYGSRSNWGILSIPISDFR